MLRPLPVTVYQCGCGYASIYKQKAARHAVTCLATGQRGCITALDRVIPADSPAPAQHKIACGSAEEQRVWEDVVREFIPLSLLLTTMSADRAVVQLFGMFRRRTANVRVCGSSVVEYRGNSQTSVPLRKYCVWAAHDIALRIATLDDRDDAAVQHVKYMFARPVNPDDDVELGPKNWGDVLQDVYNKRAVKLDGEFRDSLLDMYKDIETILKNL